MADNFIDKTKAQGSEKQESQLNRLRSWAKSESNARIRDEVLWYEIQLYKDGDHYVIIPERARTSGGNIRVQAVTRRKGEIQRTYNKIRPLLRALKSTVTSTGIRWEVPGGSDEEVMGSNYLNWYVDHKPHFQEVVGDVNDYGFSRSVGYFDVYWDSTKAEPMVMARDPFDLLMDKYGKYARRTYTMRKEDFMEMRDAEGVALFEKTDELRTTNKHSASEIFDNYLRNKRETSNPKDDKLEDVMVEEFHILEQKEDGKFQVRIITTTEESIVINKEEVYDDDELRFIAYYPERRPGYHLNEPWLKDALDPQKSLDNMYTHFEEFIRTLGKGRIMKRKGGFLDRISDKDGQIVEFEGEKPEFIQPTSLTGDQFNFDTKVEAMLEDVMGIHPSQQRKTETARGISFLIAQDETNVSESAMNMKNSLVKVGQRLLKFVDKHMMASQDIFWFKDGQKQTAQIIGGQAGNVPEGVVRLGNVEALTVDLVPKGAFAALLREEKIMKLVEMGILSSPDVIVSGLNIGNVREIVDKEMAFRQQQAEQQSQMEQARATQPTQPDEATQNKEALREAIEGLKKP